MATQAATAAGEEIKHTTSSAGPKIKFQHGPRRKPLRGGGTVPALALPSQSLSHQSDVPPGAAGDFALPTAEDIALASARDSTKREKSRDSEVEAARARRVATRLQAPSAPNQLTPRVPSRPKTPKEIAIARCGNVSALISSDSDSDVGDQDDQAGVDRDSKTTTHDATSAPPPAAATTRAPGHRAQPLVKNVVPRRSPASPSASPASTTRATTAPPRRRRRHVVDVRARRPA